MLAAFVIGPQGGEHISAGIHRPERKVRQTVPYNSALGEAAG
jgi:hypothetical protein